MEQEREEGGERERRMSENGRKKEKEVKGRRDAEFSRWCEAGK